jgi:TolA-binding protein
VRAEQSGEIADEPRIDTTLPEFQAAAKVREEGKLAEARQALTQFLQKYPNSPNAEAAKDLLGDTNMDILLSKYPTPRRRNTS